MSIFYFNLSIVRSVPATLATLPATTRPPQVLIQAPARPAVVAPAVVIVPARPTVQPQVVTTVAATSTTTPESTADESAVPIEIAPAVQPAAIIAGRTLEFNASSTGLANASAVVDAALSRAVNGDILPSGSTSDQLHIIIIQIPQVNILIPLIQEAPLQIKYFQIHLQTRRTTVCNVS